MCGGHTSPHKPRLVVSHSTCSPLSSSPHAHSFVLGTAVINNNAAVLARRMGINHLIRDLKPFWELLMMSFICSCRNKKYKSTQPFWPGGLGHLDIVQALLTPKNC